MKKLVCPNCKKRELRPWKFELGYGVEAKSMHCTNCKFNVTAPEDLEKAMKQLSAKMAKRVKVINVGEGLGIRFPKELALYYNVKKGQRVTVRAEKSAIKIFL